MKANFDRKKSQGIGLELKAKQFEPKISVMTSAKSSERYVEVLCDNPGRIDSFSHGYFDIIIPNEMDEYISRFEIHIAQFIGNKTIRKKIKYRNSIESFTAYNITNDSLEQDISYVKRPNILRRITHKFKK